MNETGIVLDYSPFVRESKIYIMQEGKQSCSKIASSVEEIVNTIIDLAYENNVYNVFIHAPKFITNGISKDISNYERNQYSINRIKVEGI